jgi:predicted  nucleic acid-binding Zn-ribbon protein
MEIVGNDAQFNEKVTLLKDLEIYGNIKNKTEDTSFDFSNDISFKIQGNEKLRIVSESTTFTDSVTAPSAIFSGIITATNVSVAQSVTANEYYGTFKGSIDPSVADDKISEGNSSAEVVDTGSDGHFKVLTENTERFRIDSDGKLNLHSGTIVGGTLPYAYFSVPTSNYGGVNLTMNLHDTASEAIGNGGGLGFSAIGVSGNPIVRAAIRGNTEATSSEAGYLTLHTRTNAGGNDERLRITSSGNVGIGSDAPTSKLDVQGFVTSSNTPKAFVNFDGTTNTGGNCTIRDSHNVSSVTDNGPGLYTINFSTAFANTNYVITVGHSSQPNNGSTHGILYTNVIATGSVSVINFADNDSSNRVDKDMISVVIHAT